MPVQWHSVPLFCRRRRRRSSFVLCVHPICPQPPPPCIMRFEIRTDERGWLLHCKMRRRLLSLNLLSLLLICLCHSSDRRERERENHFAPLLLIIVNSDLSLQFRSQPPPTPSPVRVRPPDTSFDRFDPQFVPSRSDSQTHYSRLVLLFLLKVDRSP